MAAAQQLATEVELTLSARNLRNMDLFSKSDPMVVVYQRSCFTGQWQIIGRTEVIMNNLNPDFATKIVMQYRFEEQQLLKFEIYDIDSSNLNDLSQHDFLGTASTTLGQIVSSGKSCLDLRKSLDSKDATNIGNLIIVAEELSTNNDEVECDVSIKNLKTHWFMWHNLTYFEIEKVDENGEYSLVYRSESKKRSASEMFWKRISMPVRMFCGNDLDRAIRFRFFNCNRTGSSRLIGQTCVTLTELKKTPEDQDFPLANDEKPGQAVGNLLIRKLTIKKAYSFLEFVLNGMQIHCTVAIDFTSSNGDPNFSNSLHFFHPSELNQYEQALFAVVEILQDYDSDKQFPVLGFGAKVPPMGAISHCFFVNLHASNPFCDGVQGVMQAYKSCIRQVQLYGPTNFSPVINHVSQYARAYQDGSQYFILMIITDGVITDMLQTKKAIIDAAELPLSIIIIGVGNADFDAMSELDGDVVPLSAHGKTAARDIVQFVPFREIQSINHPAEAKAKLAQEVLAEIPRQVVSFMCSRGFVPGHRKDAPGPLEPPPPYSEI